MDWEKDHLHLRVDKKNDGALKMYEGLAYEKQEHSFFGHGRDTTILLKRKLSDGGECDSNSDSGASADIEDQTAVAQDNSIEYVI